MDKEEPKIHIRMDASSWSQIQRDLEKVYQADVAETEVWESVEEQKEDGSWFYPSDEYRETVGDE